MRAIARLLARCRTGSERGQMIMLTAVMLVVVVGMGGLAVDVGFYLHEGQRVQNAVDAGALAGAPLLPNDGVGAQAAALQYTLNNNPKLSSADVTISFRCLVNDVSTGVPALCDPKGDASWSSTSSGAHVSPCVPSDGDKCNVILVSAHASQKYFLAPVLHIFSGDTGMLNSAACSGSCGGLPPTKVDVALVMDRTSSMSSSDLTNARAAASAMLQTWNPSAQWIALGLLGPSKTTSSCSGSGSPANGLAASSSQYDTTTIAKWVPVGLTGTGAPVNQSYATNGTLNQSSTIVKAINCFDTSSTGTNLSTPIKMATTYLQTNGRSGVHKGIVLETDGTPNWNGAGSSTDYTCQAAAAAATTAKNAGIEIYTIGFGVSSSDLCPDSSGTYKNKSVTTLLADMATSSGDNGCTASENSDSDHFYCLPKTSQLASIFQTVAGQIAAGPYLIPPP